MITNHTQLLNYLIEKHGLKSYLEIGVQVPANNFNKIRANFKYGVDPDLPESDYIFGRTSDDFFDNILSGGFIAYNFGRHSDENFSTFDLIFIDGLHHADQVERDFNNALACLNDGGYIVIHDVLPTDQSTTHVPRDSKMWHGDVYKFCMTLKNYSDIDFLTIDMDNGCCIVWKSPGKKNNFSLPVFKVSWLEYVNHRNEFLNIIQPSEIEKYF